MDDDTGWNDVLLSLWSDDVRDDVVQHIERAAVGRFGWLARVFTDQEGVSGSLTETVHALVMAAIRDETGADLEALGSQAAWECYEGVWSSLAERWADGGPLAFVRLGSEPVVVRAIQALPPEAAVAAAADISGELPEPLWLRGRLRIDEDGLRAYLGMDGGRSPATLHAAATTILANLHSQDARRPDA